MRREVPLFFAFLAGVMMIVSFFIPHAIFQDFNDNFRNAFIIMGSFAVVLGIGNLIQVNVRRVSTRSEDWEYKLVLLIALFVMMVAGLIPAWRQYSVTTNPFGWMFNYMYVPMQSTMFSMLAFFIASAAFRAFRMRNTEAALLLIAATIVMLGQVPIGKWLSDHFYLKIFDPQITDWIMNKPNVAAKRAILIGAAFGGISQAVRIIVGIERSYLGNE